MKLPDRNIPVATQEELESAVIVLCAELFPDCCAAMKKQLSLSKISDRSFTGVGFFTYFSVPDSAPLFSLEHRYISSLKSPNSNTGICVAASGPGFPESGVGFQVQVFQGKLSDIEGYTYGDLWPANLAGTTVHYAPVTYIS